MNKLSFGFTECEVNGAASINERRRAAGGGGITGFNSSRYYKYICNIQKMLQLQFLVVGVRKLSFDIMT